MSRRRLGTPPVGVVDLELPDVRLGDLSVLKRFGEATLGHVAVDLLLRVPDLDDVPPGLRRPGDVDVSLLGDPQLRDDLVVLLAGCPRHVVDATDHVSSSLGRGLGGQYGIGGRRGMNLRRGVSLARFQRSSSFCEALPRASGRVRPALPFRPELLGTQIRSPRASRAYERAYVAPSAR